MKEQKLQELEAKHEALIDQHHKAQFELQLEASDKFDKLSASLKTSEQALTQTQIKLDSLRTDQ